MYFLFIISLILAAAVAFFISMFGVKLGLVDYPNYRSSHSIPIPKGGGMGIPIGFLLVSILVKTHISIWLPAILISFLSFLSDKMEIPPRRRFLLQLLIALLFLNLINRFYLFTVENVLIIVFSALFIVATANFFNFMDGINGIAGITALIAFSFIAYFSFYIINDKNIALMSIVLVIGCLGFLPFNFPKAKVFMGDVGSVFLGFIFAVFVVKLSSTVNIFLCLIMFMSTFYADAIITIFYRLKNGENLTKAHRNHLYQYLSNELGIAHWKVTAIYALVQIVCGFLSIILYNKTIGFQLILIFGFGLVSLMVYKNIKNRLLTN
ncbi:MAG: hypothetical protein A2474_04310 [Elusimicrobia bacterium RIFOXYC2_FULL_34_12]|nr:MAG: hypothetical protein A2474_04310 [Elusimicrobia bacterium RIFOXYC2_FULL_34_12]HAM37872.1 UDP-N-acetylmuramyl pentapeptide phosphotransferase [Elusimicrobiota bacterium]